MARCTWQTAGSDVEPEAVGSSRRPTRPVRSALIAVFAVLLLIGHGTARRLEAAPPRPNVILLMCDDLGWGDVGFHGNHVIQTPHLDAMAAAGWDLTRFYAQAPVCSPTRGSCLTGRHPYRYGIPFANTGHMRAAEVTIAEYLRLAGYRTGHFGKWHLGTMTKTIRDSNRGGPTGSSDFAPPQDHGFDVCFSTEAKVPTCDPMWKPVDARQRGWSRLTDRSKAEPYGTHYWNEKGEVVGEGLDGDDSRVIVDRVVPFVTSSVDQGTPFLAVVWFHAPHLPVVADATHRQLYSERSEFEQNYFGCITAMDEQVGRIRRLLRELQIADDTMIWFCSDNGPEGDASAPGSAGPFRGRKRSLYEGGIRVPAVWEWPGRLKPKQCDFPATTSDYLPTLLAILELEPVDARPFDGISLYPLVDQSARSAPTDARAIGFQSRGQVAWIESRYKLIRPRENRAWELYDLLADQVEENDLAAELPEVTTSMIDAVTRWQMSCAESARGEDYRLSPRPIPQP